MLADCVFRNSQRILHIPFFIPNQRKTDQPEQQLQREARMKRARKNASASVGELIVIGTTMVNSMERLKKEIFPQVTKLLPNVHTRTQKCYAQIIMVAEIVSIYQEVVHDKVHLMFS